MEGFQNDSSQPCVCIGSKLRLLSQLKVRYEGTLYSVDTAKSTISLKNVRTFGTEGRSVDGNEVPGSDELFEIIVFRAADISEIFMIEGPAAALSADPAIVDYQQTREKQNAPNVVPAQREFPSGHNVTSVSDSRVSTPGPESVQSGDVHHVPTRQHDLGHVGAKAVKGWGSDHRGNDRDQQWGPPHRAGHTERRQGSAETRRDRDNYNHGESNGPYSAVTRKVSANNGSGNARSYQNQPQGRNASYGYDALGNTRQSSARQGGFYSGGQQGTSHYGHDQDHRPGYRQADTAGRVGWREQRERPEYPSRGGPGRGGASGQSGYYNQRDTEHDRNQAVPQQHRRQQYVNARETQASQRGRTQPQQRKEGPSQGGQRSRDRENQQRDPHSSNAGSSARNVPEFDFEKANEEFKSLSLNPTPIADGENNGNASETNENKETEDGKVSEPTYQKDSFFDDISRDSRQAQRPKTSERSLNMQTFGAAATRRRPATGRYYNRRPGNWTGSTGGANGNSGEGAVASTNGTAQISA